jgi:hypothetical protein
MLVYDYMPNQSRDKMLYNVPKTSKKLNSMGFVLQHFDWCFIGTHLPS